MGEPKSRKEKACQNDQCLEGKLCPPRELWFCFSGAHFQRCMMRSPQISVQSTWASRQMIKGLLSESSHEHSPPFSTHDSHRHLPACRQGPGSISRVAAVCVHRTLMPFGFLVLMASASHGVDRQPHKFSLGSLFQ